MGKPLERDFQKVVLRDLKQIPNLYCHKAMAGSIRGIPDIIGCVNGMFFGIELKRSKTTKADKLQIYTGMQIAKAGGLALVAYPENWDKIKEILQRYAGEKSNVQNLLS